MVCFDKGSGVDDKNVLFVIPILLGTKKPVQPILMQPEEDPVIQGDQPLFDCHVDQHLVQEDHFEGHLVTNAHYAKIGMVDHDRSRPAAGEQFFDDIRM
ncbi:MAG: hypothetical protein BGO91_20110 [Leifsonia sp. 71-9]|nr:MAG: hypothetical protein BGO91_20110 [Leifsonia sp. 71-9]